MRWWLVCARTPSLYSLPLIQGSQRGTLDQRFHSLTRLKLSLWTSQLSVPEVPTAVTPQLQPYWLKILTVQLS